jgi:uncharacterized membrane protein
LWLLAATPLLFAIISLPLMLGLIEPNPFYGVRNVATFASEEVWYRANRASGIAGVVAGPIGFVANVMVARSKAPAQRKIWICLGILLAVTAVMIVPGLIAA